MIFLKTIFLTFAIEGGLIPGHDVALTNNYSFIDKSTISLNQSFYTDMQFTIDFGKYFFISGGLTSYQWAHKGEADFFPFRMDYQFGAGAKYKSVEIGWAHDCFHQVMPYMILQQYEKLDVSHTRFYVKAKIRMPLFE